MKSHFSLVACAAAVLAASNAKADPVGDLNATGDGLSMQTQGAYQIYTWQYAGSDGTFVVPEGGATVDLLLVGGGGAGGFCRGGGGGGGGVVYKQGVALEAGTYTVTVGAGGVPDAWTKDTRPNQSSEKCYQQVKSSATTCGGDSELKLASASLYTAVGGGGGGSFVDGDNAASAGWSGGSGGGSAGKSSVQPAGTADQGSAGGGGGGNVNNDNISGGGGGAGAAGVTPSSTSASGNGGDGIECSITGLPVYYGGGGGGGAYEDRTPGQGGLGGGGNGGYKKSANEGMTAGVDGLGGGGGGSSGSGNKWEYCVGAAGGSGVVIVRYQLAGMIALGATVGNENARELGLSAKVTSSDGSDSDLFDIYAACDLSAEAEFAYEKIGDGVALNAVAEKVFGGLEVATDYYIAVKAYNRTKGTWSDPQIVVQRTSENAEAVAVTGPGIVKTDAGYRVSVRVDRMQANVTDFTLTLNGESKAVSAPGVYTWDVASTAPTFTAPVKIGYKAGGSSYTDGIESTVANGERIVLGDLSTMNTDFFFVGDRILLPGGAYSVFGDAIASLDGQTVVCKKAGFSLLNDGTSSYRICVVPYPPAGGDVFYWYSNNGNGENWTSVAWTKVTQNTDRTYPNNANDIAVIEGGCCWAKMLIDANISLHGYVVGVARTITSGDGWVQLETANGSTLTFCGSKDNPACFNLSSMYTGTCRIRFGREKGTGNEVLNVQVDAERMIFDFCGDSAVCGNWHRGNGLFSFCSAVITVPEGSSFEFVNASRVATDTFEMGNTAVGHFSGAGSIVAGSCVIPISVLKFPGDEFAGDIAVRTADWKGMVELPGSDLTVFDAPNAGRKMVAIGYDNCSSNPGRSQIDAKSVTLDGGCLRIYRNYAENSNLTPWTEGATTDEEKAARLTVTNEIKKLVVKGDSAFYCECSYGTTRVRQHLILDEIEHDKSGTVCLYDFNFRDKSWRTDPLHYDRVKGPGLAAYAVGRDWQEGDSQTVYKIIPWMACTVNDNGYEIYGSWGSQMNFPALVNGELKDVYGRNSGVGLADAGEWDNILYTGKGISALGGKTIHSFAYDTAETAPFPGNLVLGAGKTLTIKSGGLIMARSGRWLGCTQTSNFSKNGAVAFGDRAYVISDYGVPNGDTGREYNAIWASMVAPYGLTKGGCGELVFAADQRGIDGDISIGGGTLWLGHPANYKRNGWLYENQSGDIPVRGCATDVEEFTLRPGAVLGVPLKGYDVDGNGAIDKGETAIARNASISLFDNAAGSAKIEIAEGADQTCAKLFINDKPMPRGSYGASGSGADIIDDLHFVGKGVLTVTKEESPGFLIIIR